MSDQNDFFSFEEALDSLRLKEEELKRLVSEGEIRAFREGETMKLRRTDVEHLKSELMGGEVVELGGGGDDLVFEDDFEDPGMATEELTAADTLIDEDLGVLDEIEEEPLEVEEPEPVAVGPVEEPVHDSPGVLAAAICTVALLVLSGPVLISSTSGNMSDLAKSIAGIFVSFEGEGGSASAAADADDAEEADAETATDGESEE
ncbi:MAG: hypothetical protein AAFZ65_12265 [Planctomycetota bacterium]